MQQQNLQQSRSVEVGVKKENFYTEPTDIGIPQSARSDENSQKGQQNMGKITITLENTAVHAGTLLKGKVSVISSKNEVDKICLKLEGVGTVKLESDNGKTYSAQEIYLCDKMPIWSKRENQQYVGGKGAELTVPFEYHIQPDAQASFDGHYARIQYTCTAIVKYAGTLGKRQQAVSRFLVLPQFDAQVHDSPSTRTVQKRKTFRSFGIKDGQVQVDLDMDKISAERGDEIGFTVTVNNESQLHLRNLKFGIIQMVTSVAKGRQVVEKHVIKEFDENVYLKPTEIWQGRRMCTIDKNLQPTLIAKGNKINCQVSYCYFATVIPPNFSNSCELTYPLYVY